MSKKRAKIENEAEFFGTESVWKILLKISPPVMLSQLVLSLYNIVDSLFVGQYSGHGLTALSVIYPLQLVITALAVGTGVGVNTYMSRLYARGEIAKAKATAGTGMVLAVLMWAIFAGVSALIMKPYRTHQKQSNTPINTEWWCASARSARFWKAYGRKCINRTAIWLFR